MEIVPFPVGDARTLEGAGMVVKHKCKEACCLGVKNSLLFCNLQIMAELQGVPKDVTVLVQYKRLRGIQQWEGNMDSES